MVMKPIGGGVHIRRRTVRWPLVGWLCIGSIPMAFAGVFIIHNVGDSDAGREPHETVPRVDAACSRASAMVFKAWLQGRRSLAGADGGGDPRDGLPPFAVRVIPT